MPREPFQGNFPSGEAFILALIARGLDVDGQPAEGMEYFDTTLGAFQYYHNGTFHSRMNPRTAERVIEVNRVAPPVFPDNADLYATHASPSGAWSGQGTKFARWNGNIEAWTFCAPVDGVRFQDSFGAWYFHSSTAGAFLPMSEGLPLADLSSGRTSLQDELDAQAGSLVNEASSALLLPGSSRALQVEIVGMVLKLMPGLMPDEAGVDLLRCYPSTPNAVLQQRRVRKPWILNIAAGTLDGISLASNPAWEAIVGTLPADWPASASKAWCAIIERNISTGAIRINFGTGEQTYAAVGAIYTNGTTSASAELSAIGSWYAATSPLLQNDKGSPVLLTKMDLCAILSIAGICRARGVVWAADGAGGNPGTILAVTPVVRFTETGSLQTIANVPLYDLDGGALIPAGGQFYAGVQRVNANDAHQYTGTMSLYRAAYAGDIAAGFSAVGNRGKKYSSSWADFSTASTGAVCGVYGQQTCGRPAVTAGWEIIGYVGAPAAPVRSGTTSLARYHVCDMLCMADGAVSSFPGATVAPIAIPPAPAMRSRWNAMPYGFEYATYIFSALRGGSVFAARFLRDAPHRFRLIGDNTWKYGLGLGQYHGEYSGSRISSTNSAELMYTGGPLDDDTASVYSVYSEAQAASQDCMVHETIFVPGRYADSNDATLIASDLRCQFIWRNGPAKLVAYELFHKTADTGATQPRVETLVNGASVFGPMYGVNDAQMLYPNRVGTWGSTNYSNYSVAYGDVLELSVTKGTNGDAQDLTVVLHFTLLDRGD